jgi:hypothetical protein
LKLVLWNVYGTLLTIAEGDLKYQSDRDLMLNIALDKTIAEFKMWASMSRKPGQPADYMKEIYRRALNEARMLPSRNESQPETRTELIWENIIKRLLQKEYKFDAAFYGSLNQYSQKVAFFFHANMQGTGPMPCAARTVRQLAASGIQQGLWADGQCFTPAHLGYHLAQQDYSCDLDLYIPQRLRILSHEVKGRKPGETMQQNLLAKLAAFNIAPQEVLHVGCSMSRDIIAAKSIGLRTALFVGDKTALVASTEELRDETTRPDMLLTDLAQLELVLG